MKETDLGNFRLLREFNSDLKVALAEQDLHRRRAMLEAIGSWVEKVARIWPELADFDLWFRQLETALDETQSKILEFFGNDER